MVSSKIVMERNDGNRQPWGIEDHLVLHESHQFFSYSDQCQGLAVKGLQKLTYRCSVFVWRFPLCIVRRLFACTRVPHREGNSMGGPPLFNVGIRNRGGCCVRGSVCLNRESNQASLSQGPVTYPLNHRFSPKEGKATWLTIRGVMMASRHPWLVASLHISSRHCNRGCLLCWYVGTSVRSFIWHLKNKGSVDTLQLWKHMWTGTCICPSI